MCQGMQCPFEGYEGECNLTTKETRAVLNKFNREPCPDFSDAQEENEYWDWIEQVEAFLDELREQEEKEINELLDIAMKGK